jgi:hypothetical protein
MNRDATGTSWQPDSGEHAGIHTVRGDWTVMTHALLNLTYDTQSGPRGGDKTFVSGMLMTTARRNLDDGSTLNLRAMLSPDPLMGKSGYPLLLAAGETANGVDPLVDRQHPHDFFMELSASYSKRLSDKDSLYGYIGLPGEPAGEKLIDRVLRVNLAGEYGAVRIYEGQLAVLGRTSPAGAAIAHMAKHVVRNKCTEHKEPTTKNNVPTALCCHPQQHHKQRKEQQRRT